MKMALMTLQNEVQNTMGIRFYRGSIVNVLRRYFKDLPRTRKAAYKYLKERGHYDN
jgi:spore coat polysaccharide biosynthesis protein SpsF (cytidylyltransferase family)